MTWTDLVATAAAIPLVVIITNGLRMASGGKLSAPWVALAVSFVLELGVWWFAMGGTAEAAGIALLNVFIVYVGATGGNEMVGAAMEKMNGKNALRGVQHKSQFWQGWF